ncbi:WhiB family transcriptional regulator [Microlunatus sp. Gsoil 973]|uniref:WhiB family transcriptional regulator n=1 Tax=Microlunatus sp. Gsoil 973 TaxID=2672569 RepID=UPI0012B498E7|nr:WhiB family transcriptional regulator [Microlunatus sp. Gsoil 973]QGN33960.1 hypothetical protein GJV80_15310 [Microlunatus sp. Gsoil 973]
MTALIGLGWMDEAACLTVPELPWIGPRRGQPLDPGALEQMTQTCDHCPVLNQCRHYVDQAAVSAGFWAGAWRHLSPDARVEDAAGGQVA